MSRPAIRYMDRDYRVKKSALSYAPGFELTDELALIDGEPCFTLRRIQTIYIPVEKTKDDAEMNKWFISAMGLIDAIWQQVYMRIGVRREPLDVEKYIRED